jgi:hypothetical protein
MHEPAAALMFSQQSLLRRQLMMIVVSFVADLFATSPRRRGYLYYKPSVSAFRVLSFFNLIIL